jgi:hypothetical protein
MSVANLRIKLKGVEAVICFSSVGARSFVSFFSFMTLLFLINDLAANHQEP